MCPHASKQAKRPIINIIEHGVLREEYILQEAPLFNRITPFCSTTQKWRGSYITQFFLRMSANIIDVVHAQFCTSEIDDIAY